MNESNLNVWFVDDLQQNLNRFTKQHPNWNVRKFLKISDVLNALNNEKIKPDALFVDIVFYENATMAMNIEKDVNIMAKKIHELSDKLGATKEIYLGGVRLIEQIAESYKNRFPIYAYTSKGPYILNGKVLDRIANKQIPIVFKGRLSPDSEELIVKNDLNRIYKENSFKYKFIKSFSRNITIAGVLGWIVGKLLEIVWSNLNLSFLH